jgi:dTDP-4-dehydrorhamnose 3,5-epimerase
MKVTKTAIPEVLVFEPTIYQDDRGFLFESFNRTVAEAIGQSVAFVQDNHSTSKANVLRGLHYQVHPHVQGKLIRAVVGEIFDVAVDIRRSSPTFGRWISERLSAQNRKIMWIPPGFAHGFLVLSETADCIYKTTAYYSPKHERTVLWNDKDLGIDWPHREKLIVSSKDADGSPFNRADVFD